MNKIKSFWQMLSRDIYVGRRLKNNLLALTLVSILTSVLGLVLVILDIVTKNYFMLIPALITLIGGILCGILSGLFKKRKIAIWVPIIFCLVAFIYYAITGAANGTAIFWALLMPLGICYFVNVKTGLLMSLYYIIFFCVLFYTPLNQYVKDYYTKDILERFPMLFTAMSGFTLIAMIQYHRVALVEIDYQKKLKEEVAIQTKYATDRAIKLENITEEIVKTLARVIDAKDKYTNGHSFRVALYACALAKSLNFSENEIKEIRWEGLLHDIGKIGIPDNVLNKNGHLTDSEYDLIKSHTVIGDEILKESSELKNAALTTRHHHERYDGKGYPDGLMKEEIPLHARILAIADSYDAMNSNRIYRKSLSKEVIKEELIKNRGTQFDPNLLDKFLELFNNGTLDLVELDSKKYII